MLADVATKDGRMRLRRWAVAFLAIGIVLRLVRYLLRFPVWGDEAFICLNLMGRDFAGLLRPLRFDQVAPVLFLWSQKAAYLLLGGSELALRLLPLLAGTASLVLFARLARSSLRPAAALLALGILAVSYYPVRHSCEVKPYAYDLCASLVLMTPAAVWLRHPDRRFPLAILVGAVPLALASSYPAVFVAGGVSVALLPAVWRRQDRTVWGLYIAFNLLMVGAFILLFTAVGAAQHRSMVDGSGGYWDGSFPPGEAWPRLRWLVSVHAGNMLAYPVGGRDGGSTLTLLLCVVGVIHLWSARRRSVLLLCGVPFVLTFVAAAMGRYPYGGSARVAQHLAPAVCLLAGAGAAALVKKRGMMAACIFLLVIGGALLVRDICKPYKTDEDRRAREFVRQVMRRADSGRVVVLDAPPRLYPSFEWYLRRHGGRVVWVKSLEEVPVDGVSEFWCLRFRTNAMPCEQWPARWTGGGGEVFELRRCEEHALNMGPEADATHCCDVLLWKRRQPAAPARVFFHPCWRCGLSEGRP